MRFNVENIDDASSRNVPTDQMLISRMPDVPDIAEQDIVPCVPRVPRSEMTL